MADRVPRLERAIERFRQENSRDPNTIVVGGQPRPKELVDAERLATWVERLEPDAAEPLTLASYSQHLRRWEIPRTSFTQDRIGYLKWRKALAKFHADATAAILADVGYDEQTIAAVRRINLKQDVHASPDVQAIEDALCLSFLEHEFDDFRGKHPPEKVVDIVGKTWRKMSERARTCALALALPDRALELIGEALKRP